MWKVNFLAIWIWLAVTVAVLTGCEGAWNNPYPPQATNANVMYSSFSERPKHFDPARSYSSNEYEFIGQIYEPPLQYHYLKRPYELIPLTATEVPKPAFFDAAGNPLSDDADPSVVARSVYTLRIKPGIRYQPHPAFAKDEQGQPLYLGLTAEDVAKVYTLADFPKTGSRELVAADYVYEIKRLAHPALNSPSLGTMADYIIGLPELAKTLQKARDDLKKVGGSYLDLNAYSLAGVEVVDNYTYRISIKGVYPQLVYWLAMPFFAPMPAEADRFYAQVGLAEKNITLDWYPVGTGAYMLSENNPNLQMVLDRNPNYRGELFPSEGDVGDKEAGLLVDAGKPTPFIDRVVYKLETETIPYWNKFLQGYYDTSGISSDSFDQAVQVGAKGDVSLTDSMREKNIRLATTVATSSFYMGFNMRDVDVGGLSERSRKLRQAISIAMDYEEFIAIFANGRGIAAQGPVPPGIFGYLDGERGTNKFVYDWVDGKPKRKSIEDAKRLLAEAGYANGVDSATGKPLVLNLDINANGPDDKARLDWYRKQFQKLNLQLVIRNTQYNRFQEKMQKGTAQIFIWGWNADYPDPENFLFLLYGPNGKVEKNGENAANYSNPAFDRLFDRMKNMANGEPRQQLINEMTALVQNDSPWIWGMHPKNFGLYHAWYKNAKPNLMSHNTLQYKRIEPAARAASREAWNQPVTWPLILLAIGSVLLLVPAFLIYRKSERQAPAGVR